MTDWYQLEKLHFAAREGDVATCERLLADGFDPNGFDELGYTPLHYAAKEERFEVVDFLLAHGARINIQCESMICNTPLA